MCPIFVWVLWTASCQNVALCQTSAVSIMCVTSCLSKQKAKLLPCRQRSVELYFSCKVWDQDKVWPQCTYALLLRTWQTDRLNGSFQMLLAVLMIWGEEICTTDLLEFMAKSKIQYKSATSHQPALQNSHFKVLVPKPPKVWSVRRRWWKYSDVKCNK